MENRNIYKMDDFLIITSYIMIIPLIILAWPWIRTFSDFESMGDFFSMAPQILGNRLTAIAVYGGAAVSAQIIGRIIRFGESQSLEILDTLQFYKKTTISQLASQLDMSEAKVKKLVGKMSRISSLGIIVEGEQVSIGAEPEATAGYSRSYSSASETAQKYASTETASNSYESVETSFEMTQETVESSMEEQTDASKGNDGASFDSEFREALKKATNKNLSELERKEELKKIATNLSQMKGSSGVQGEKKFNFILFIVLFLTPLWPIALIYAISFAVKQRNSALTNRNSPGE